MVVLSCSFLVTVSCLVVVRREQGRRGSTASLPPRSCPALTLSTGEKCEPGEKERSGLERACSTAEESPQLFRHSLLLMLLATSTFSGVAITASRLADIWAQDGQFAGVYKVVITATLYEIFKNNYLFIRFLSSSTPFWLRVRA